MTRDPSTRGCVSLTRRIHGISVVIETCFGIAVRNRSPATSVRVAVRRIPAEGDEPIALTITSGIEDRPWSLDVTHSLETSTPFSSSMGYGVPTTVGVTRIGNPVLVSTHLVERTTSRGMDIVLVMAGFHGGNHIYR